MLLQQRPILQQLSAGAVAAADSTSGPAGRAAEPRPRPKPWWANPFGRCRQESKRRSARYQLAVRPVDVTATSHLPPGHPHGLEYRRAAIAIAPAIDCQP